MMGMVSGDNRVGDEVYRCLLIFYGMITTHKSARRTRSKLRLGKRDYKPPTLESYLAL